MSAQRFVRSFALRDHVAGSSTVARLDALVAAGRLAADFATDLGGQARSAMVRGLLPNALWWFRWGAMFTFLTGWTIVLMHIVTGTGSMPYYAMILTGGTLGTFMWYNVWFVIMPRQRLAIASAEAVAGGGQANPEAAKQAPLAGRASRTNVMFSIPMLFFMGAAKHYQMMVNQSGYRGFYWFLIIVILGAIECNALMGTQGPTKKPLDSVKGALWTGFLLTGILFLLTLALT